MTTPVVIGLTLNYRDAVRTARCARHLLCDGAAHVLVLDNSADEGRSAGSLRMLLKEEVRVSVEVSHQNLGFSVGVNRGLALILDRFPKAWVLLINNDAVVLNGCIEALCLALMDEPRSIISYPTIDHAGVSIGTAFYQKHFGLYLRSRLPSCIPYASGCCQLLAPERLTGAWFDEDFFMYGEDVELGWRLGEQSFVHVQGVWATHEVSASSGKASSFYESNIVAAHWLLARKLARNPFERWVFVVGRAMALPVRALARAWRYSSLEPLWSLFMGWHMGHRRS